MAGGRPTKYNQELVTKAREYLNGGYEQLNEVVPTHEGLAEWINIARKTLYEWAKEEDKQEFCDILEDCNKKQSRMLLSGSLRGDLNPAISKLMLGKQGYSERLETVSEVKATVSQSIDLVDAARMIDFMLAKSKADQQVIDSTAEQL